MKITKTLQLLGLGLVLGIFLISVVSAQTLVAGKIYDSGYDNLVSDADVNVVCNSNTLTTTSLSDGTYAVRFEQTDCDLGDDVDVNAVKGILSGSGSGTVIECNEENDCAEGYVSIINLAIKSQYSGSHSGSSRYYLCGNGKCDTGESANTCPKDCLLPSQNQEQTQQTQTPDTNSTQTTAGVGIVINPPENKTNGISRITGGVIGALGTGWIIVIIFIAAILILSLIVRFIRKRKDINTDSN